MNCMTDLQLDPARSKYLNPCQELDASVLFAALACAVCKPVLSQFSYNAAVFLTLGALGAVLSCLTLRRTLVPRGPTYVIMPN